MQPQEIIEKVEKPKAADVPRPKREGDAAERARPTARDRQVHEAIKAQRPEAKAAYQEALFQRNERAMRHTVETAEVIKPDKAAQYSAHNKIQGQVAESAYHYTHGGAVGLVNDLNTAVGKHNAIYDTSSSREVASIKTHLSEKNKNAPGTYARDLRKMVGELDGQKHDKLSNQLWEKKQAGGREWARAEAVLPPEVVGARTPEAMKTALIDKSALRIPADQVQPTRDHVVRNAMRHPETYGIDPKAPPVEREMRATMLAMKIKPLADNLTSHDLRLMSRECYQRRFGLSK